MFESDPTTALITAIGFSAFASITFVGIITVMYVSSKLFPEDTEKRDIEIKILKEKLSTAKHRNERTKKEKN